jgi:hypothetical protein
LGEYKELEEARALFIDEVPLHWKDIQAHLLVNLKALVEGSSHWKRVIEAIRDEIMPIWPDYKTICETQMPPPVIAPNPTPASPSSSTQVNLPPPSHIDTGSTSFTSVKTSGHSDSVGLTVKREALENLYPATPSSSSSHPIDLTTNEEPNQNPRPHPTPPQPTPTPSTPDINPPAHCLALVLNEPLDTIPPHPLSPRPSSPSQGIDPKLLHQPSDRVVPSSPEVENEAMAIDFDQDDRMDVDKAPGEKDREDTTRGKKDIPVNRARVVITQKNKGTKGGAENIIEDQEEGAVVAPRNKGSKKKARDSVREGKKAQKPDESGNAKQGSSSLQNALQSAFNANHSSSMDQSLATASSFLTPNVVSECGVTTDQVAGHLAALFALPQSIRSAILEMPQEDMMRIFMDNHTKKRKGVEPGLSPQRKRTRPQNPSQAPSRKLNRIDFEKINEQEDLPEDSSSEITEDAED